MTEGLNLARTKKPNGSRAGAARFAAGEGEKPGI
jgi:hypothetical protein